MSLLRRPFTKKAFRRFTVSFFEKEIELARGRVGIQLLVPSPLFAYAKPLDDARVVFRGQAIDSSLNLLDSAHAWSLSPSLGGFISCPDRPGTGRSVPPLRRGHGAPRFEGVAEAAH